MKEQPFVSILMTSYNREKYIAEAIESVISSTYQNWELIIVDDGSKDGTFEIAKTYEQRDKRILIFQNEVNLGQFENRNKAASYAKGKYIKYLDSDDIIYPHGLETMVNAMEQFPEAGIGFSYHNYEYKEKLPILLDLENGFRLHFFRKGIYIMGPSSSIYNREYFNFIGGFGDFKVASDYEFNLRAGIHKPIVLFQNDLIWWRQHEGQEIISSNKKNDYIKLNYIINKQILKNSPLDESTKNKALRNNDIQLGRKLLKFLLNFKFKSFLDILHYTDYSIFKIFRSLYFSEKLN